MNALANSQMKELEKFLDQSELPGRLRPTFARYTGQESQEERERVKEAKPDILLTNFAALPSTSNWRKRPMASSANAMPP